ncbi:DivIVA domain-containing protein [Paenibacillus sp. TRM 82003]|uniref:DivIVA domain-containing protein n=1 Tax=Kineococcus sp. TRM81007 TaxID=2925831 RepID=UPI001F59EDC2|nr:DivIVA domain-containing protein [Kineococcus sp. TRM81007]MCI2240249.1 DivIVA domain-containing protein [Kineococcus sp. TRM81007]MCI3927574.1 DivIVA domain-containing protein [Paenibacillus sp. TRM 82003]
MTQELEERGERTGALGRRPPRTGRWRRGYRVADVDAFLDHAAQAVPARRLGSAQVRAVGFGSQFGGYDVAATDEALARLEDRLARLERVRALSGGAQRQWAERHAALNAAVLGRLDEPDGERFPRARGLRRGYRPSDVDALCTLLAERFAGGARLEAEDVRGALFRPRRGRRGYREAPVDAFLDRVVELMVSHEP